MQNGKKSDEAANYVAQMRDWVNSQPHLPKNLDDNLLLRFAHSCYYDLEKAKVAAELFFTIRTSVPDLINNRDPLSPPIQKALSIANLGQITISGNRCLWIWQVNDPGLENYDYSKDAKLFYMVSDLWFMTNDQLCDADIVIMDVKDISLKFLTKFNVFIARKLSKYQQEALPIRLKQVHVVNAPPFIDKLFGLMKPMLKKEVTELVHFHQPKSDTLFNYLDKEDLPKDFGGTLPSLEEHMKRVKENITRNRDLLLINNLWTAADKKGKNKIEAATEIDSFRSLSID
ncbi:alpha-tocopherol transfer protein-like [Epargyreus clarus]|uniref:alpha-tocopherol transfer protein-like n=1 Tax=Epargyreus clarus TaxID=520877 RepID=UPI003C2DA639